MVRPLFYDCCCLQVMHMPGPQKRPDDSGHDSGTHRPETAERCWGRQGRYMGWDTSWVQRTGLEQ